MLTQPLDQITYADIERLVADRIPESQGLEYKGELPTNADSSKTRALRSICAFANSGGGDVVFGVSEDDEHSPKDIQPLDRTTMHDAVMRLDQMIAAHIEPRLTSYRIREIDGGSAGGVLVVRVDPSFARPHRLNNVFYRRANNSDQPMDISEIRSAFLSLHQIDEQFERFRRDRVTAHRENKVQVKVPPEPHFLLHILPYSSATSRLRARTLTMSELRAIPLRPPRSGGSSMRPNLDGMCHYTHSEGDGFSAMLQIYRDLRIEARARINNADKPFFPMKALEEEMIRYLGHIQEALAPYPWAFPAAMFLSFGYTRGFTAGIPHGFEIGSETITDKEILCPGMIVEAVDFDRFAVTQALIEPLWHACGIDQSLNFDDDGNWTPSG